MRLELIDSGLTQEGFTWVGGPTVTPSLAGHSGGLEEAVIGPPNFKAIWWLRKAVEASRSVCRVVFDFGGGASGFLIGDDLLMTNNHVYESQDDVRNSELHFNYDAQPGGQGFGPIDIWEPDPDRFITNPDLDYSIIGVKEKDGKKAGEVWGTFSLNGDVPVRINHRANLIQHPQGRLKEIAFRDNQIKHADETIVQYLTDTDYGSSGSPVFDDFFNVIALHNQRVRDPADPNRWYRNQGFRIKAILEDVGGNFP